MNEKKEWPIDRFLHAVAEAAKRDDRGYLAEVRRALSKTTQAQAWEHLIPYCADFDDDDHRAVWCTVGGLAATLIPEGLTTTEPWNNLGTTMRVLAKGDVKTSGDEAAALKTFEPKFRRALSCEDTVSLCEMVVYIGRAADAKGVQMNLRALFWDLWNWEDPEKREDTRLKWAKQYYHVFEGKTDSAPTQEGEPA